MTKCEQKVQHTFQGLGKTHKSPCGKESKFVDEHGRNLCRKHFYKWFKKKYKKEYKDFIMEKQHFILSDQYDKPIAVIESDKEGNNFEANILLAIKEHNSFEKVEAVKPIHLNNCIGYESKRINVLTWMADEDHYESEEEFYTLTNINCYG